MDMDSTDAKSRRRASVRAAELELEPLALRDTIGLTLTFASLCVVSCGWVLFFESAWLHGHGETCYIGIALILGGAHASALTAHREQHRRCCFAPQAVTLAASLLCATCTDVANVADVDPFRGCDATGQGPQFWRRTKAEGDEHDVELLARIRAKSTVR